MLLTFIGLLLVCTGCDPQSDNNEDKASKVFIEQTDGAYTLFVNDEEFYVKGAGGSNYLGKLAEYGGNSIRTWSTDNAEEILDEAHQNGIMVTLGLWVGHERHGFNYNDEEAVQRQLEEFSSDVERYKNHPALLMWAIGNEYELNYSNTKVWAAVNDIAKMIKENDPNHPTMTVVAEINAQKIQHLKEDVPDIDILGVNSYGGVQTLPNRIKQFGWEKPYMVTEWGPNGHWEMPSTSWGAPLEQSSSEKQEAYLKRYTEVIDADSEQCLGSYVFLWGHKQEVTSTWYGLFLENGDEVETTDGMYKAWTGDWPEVRAPFISKLTVNGYSASSSVQLQQAKVYDAAVVAGHPNDENLTIRWELLKESTANSVGGDAEEKPEEITDFIIQSDTQGNLTFVTPEQSGPFRLFVYVKHEESGKTATANIPIYVN